MTKNSALIESDRLRAESLRRQFKEVAHALDAEGQGLTAEQRIEVGAVLKKLIGAIDTGGLDAAVKAASVLIRGVRKRGRSPTPEMQARNSWIYSEVMRLKARKVAHAHAFMQIGEQIGRSAGWVEHIFIQERRRRGSE